MDSNKDTDLKSTQNQDVPVSSAEAMTPLELNAIRLDANHTVLTPELLERMKTS